MMKRRDLLKAAGIAGLAAAVPSFAQAGSGATGKSNDMTKVETALKRLNLRHTWTTTMASDTFRETVHLHYTRDGVTGYGEGAPIIRYKEYPKEAKAAIETFREVLNPQQEPKAGTHKSDLKIADLDSSEQIRLRWTLRDIRSNRTKMFPVSPDDLSMLTEMGLVEMRNDVPVLTDEGHRAIDNPFTDQKPRR